LQYATIGGVSHFFLQLLILLHAVGKNDWLFIVKLFDTLTKSANVCGNIFVPMLASKPKHFQAYRDAASI
jgi:hypothetical protein